MSFGSGKDPLSLCTSVCLEAKEGVGKLLAKVLCYLLWIGNVCARLSQHTFSFVLLCLFKKLWFVIRPCLDCNLCSSKLFSTFVSQNVGSRPWECAMFNFLVGSLNDVC